MNLANNVDHYLSDMTFASIQRFGYYFMLYSPLLSAVFQNERCPQISIHFFIEGSLALISQEFVRETHRPLCKMKIPIIGVYSNVPFGILKFLMKNKMIVKSETARGV